MRKGFLKELNNGTDIFFAGYSNSSKALYGLPVNPCCSAKADSAL